MLLRERADDRRRPAVVGARQRGLRGWERVPAECRAPLVELLGIARHRHRRTGIAAAAVAFELVGASLARHAERPLDLVVIRLKLGVGDRPVGQRRPRQVARDRADAEVVLGEARQPTLPVHRAAADHLRHRAEQLLARRVVFVRSHGARVKDRVGPQIVPVDVGELVAAKRLATAPRPALQGDHAHAALGQHLGRRRPRRAGADDADLDVVRFPSRHCHAPRRASCVPRRTSRACCSGR